MTDDHQKLETHEIRLALVESIVERMDETLSDINKTLKRFLEMEYTQKGLGEQMKRINKQVNKNTRTSEDTKKLMWKFGVYASVGVSIASFIGAIFKDYIINKLF